ncbi:unnamed protein product [Soboliphyme baturini]|uniref:Uncharacterized protein n=1 Tax=Soboliphyme baturini TaxID=241478 RepID=A0A183IB70_9BILA|nr:unnamed protein product [Soboliphyme baturini]
MRGREGGGGVDRDDWRSTRFASRNLSVIDRTPVPLARNAALENGQRLIKQMRRNQYAQSKHQHHPSISMENFGEVKDEASRSKTLTKGRNASFSAIVHMKLKSGQMSFNCNFS